MDGGDIQRMSFTRWFPYYQQIVHMTISTWITSHCAAVEPVFGRLAHQSPDHSLEFCFLRLASHVRNGVAQSRKGSSCFLSFHSEAQVLVIVKWFSNLLLQHYTLSKWRCQPHFVFLKPCHEKGFKVAYCYPIIFPTLVRAVKMRRVFT